MIYCLYWRINYVYVFFYVYVYVYIYVYVSTSVQASVSTYIPVSATYSVTLSDTDSYGTYSMHICNTQAILTPAGQTGRYELLYSRPPLSKYSSNHSYYVHNSPQL